MATNFSSLRYVEDGEEFLNDVVSQWKNIDEKYDKDIRKLMKKVEDFTKKTLDGSSQLLYERANQIRSRLWSSLRSSSHDDDVGKEMQNASFKMAETRSGEMESEQFVSYPSQAAYKKPFGRPDSKSISLLLLGSTGNGKSATGNSILGKDAFKVNSSTSTTSSNTLSNIVKDSTGDLSVSVVDGPSINHFGEIDRPFLENIINSVEKTMDLCDYAFSSILICLKFGIRFTKQEIETIKLIKSVLGENVIKDYGICVITHGDNFQHAVEEAAEDKEELTFEHWCREQTGDVKSLFEECNFRCVLFDNKTRDKKIKWNQLQTLLNMVDLNKRYSKEEFLKAEGVKELTSYALLPELEKSTKILINEIDLEIQNIDKNIVNDPHFYVTEMLKLNEQLQAQIDLLEDLGLKSSMIVMLSQHLAALQTNILRKVKQQDELLQYKKPGLAPSKEELTTRAPFLGSAAQTYTNKNTTAAKFNYSPASSPDYVHDSHQNRHFRKDASDRDYYVKGTKHEDMQQCKNGKLNNLKTLVKNKWKAIREFLHI